MTDTPTAREIAERIEKLLLAQDFSGFADLFAADAVFEYPFVAPGWPAELHGREAIRAHVVATRGDIRTRVELTGFRTTVHQTTDPGVVVLEHVASGTTRATGQPFRLNSGVGVLTVRDGEITHYRDYTNPLGAAIAVGRLPELVQALSSAAGADQGGRV